MKREKVSLHPKNVIKHGGKKPLVYSNLHLCPLCEIESMCACDFAKTKGAKAVFAYTPANKTAR